MSTTNRIKDLLNQMREALEANIWFGGLLPVLIRGLLTMLTDVDSLVNDLEQWHREKDLKIRELRDEVTAAEGRASNAERSLPPFIPPSLKAMGYPLSLWFMRYALLTATPDKAPNVAKIYAIKYARAYYGCGLADAKNLVEAMPHVPYMQHLVTWWFTRNDLTAGHCRGEDGHESSDRFGTNDAYRDAYIGYRTEFDKAYPGGIALSPSEFLAVMFELDREEIITAGLRLPKPFVDTHGEALKGCTGSKNGIPIHILDKRE